MAENLTPQQELAVACRGGKLLVSAAAGSGKTKVLVDRLLSYILDPISPANVDDFLIITYTKAAAAELREKIAARFSSAVAEFPDNRHLRQQLQRIYLAKISTVHAFCTDILRENAYRLDIPGDFRVAEENECTELQTRAMDKVLEESYGAIDTQENIRAFIDTQGFGRNDKKVPEIVFSVYNSARCHLNPDVWIDSCVKSYGVSGFVSAEDTMWGKYLIDDLHNCLDMHIEAMTNCYQAIINIAGMEKPLAVIGDTINQMKALRVQNTWDAIHTYSIDYGTLRFGKNADAALSEKVKAIRNSCKAALTKKLSVFSMDSSSAMRDITCCQSPVKGLALLTERFGVEYSKLKRARRVLDFSDLEHLTLDLLIGKDRGGITATANEIGQRFREVMVDEYQDTNEVQDAIFTALTEKRNNCFMVGDVKQSIYQFRLADPGIFLQKYNAYCPAEEAVTGDGRKVLLNANFRSSGGVISAVNSVFSACMSRKVGGLDYGPDEALNEGIPHVALPEPEVSLLAVDVQQDTYAEEAEVVASEIAKLLSGNHMIRQGDGLRAITPGDIVILLRSPNTVGGEFYHALEKRGIRCDFGGDKNILTSEAVVTLQALLQVIDNPLQDIPLIATMMSRAFCFSANHMAEIRKADIHSPLYSILEKSEIPKVKAFIELIVRFRQLSRRCRVTELLECILTTTRLDSIYATVDPDSAEALQMFTQLASATEAMGRGDLHRFLDYLDGLKERGVPMGKESRGNVVTIMSIHKSKGLEFPVVFLSGLSKNFNREDLKDQVLCDKTLGFGFSNIDTGGRVRYPAISKKAIATKKTADSLSEELRVLYVAMTRARDRLIMTYASRYLCSQLQEIALRKPWSPRRLLTSEVSSMGEWVLQCAMGRIEAGELFAIAGRPDSVSTEQPCWDIRLVTPQELPDVGAEDAIVSDKNIDKELLGRIRDNLHYTYPYAKATQSPSKQTATQRKGRLKDDEAAEYTQKICRKYWRKPNFVAIVADSTARGTAMHKALQYLMPVTSLRELDEQLQLLLDNNRLTLQELSLIDKACLLSFYSSDIGQKLSVSEKVLREFKFSILVDAGQYDPQLSGEQILLQGVVDCAILEEDGITVIDFKTDNVTGKTAATVAEGYKMQIGAYADALSKIYRLPVKSALIYFLKPGLAIEVM